MKKLISVGFPNQTKDNTEEIKYSQLVSKHNTTILNEIIRNIVVKCNGNFAYVGFSLPGKYDWKVGKDENGCAVLIPLIAEDEES